MTQARVSDWYREHRRAVTAAVLVVALMLVGAAAAIGLRLAQDLPATADEPSAPPSTTPLESPAPTSSPGEAPTAQPSITPDASPSANPSTPVTTLAFVEQRLPGSPIALWADADSWVAVGASETGAPMAWTSSDAVTWTPHTVPDPNPELREEDGFVGSVMGPMAKWGDTWFSFGTVVGCCDGRGVLAWRSTDARTWEVIESQSPLFTDGYYVQQLLAHDGGLVARETGYPVYSSRVWTWTPEDSWVASDLGGIDDESARVWLTGLAWDGERFVAVGGPARGDYDAPPTGGVWVSADARRWEAVEVSSMTSLALDSVAAVPGGGFVAIGQQDGVHVAWGSADGRAWERRSLPTDDGVAASHIFEAGAVLVALGFGDNRTAAWVSGDGISWSGPSVLPSLDVTSVVAGSATHVVIIGGEPTSDRPRTTYIFRAPIVD